MEPTTDPAAPPPYVRALRDELVAAHGRLARRRRQRQGFATALVVLVLAGLASVLFSSVRPHDAAADVLAVTPLPDGSTEVTILDTGAGLADIRAALAANRIPNHVDGTPTGPSRVGRFISVVVASNERIALAPDHRTITVPAGYRGELRILVGVRAAPGQAYGQPSLAFDEGEPLEGYAEPENAAAVVAAGRAKGLRVRILDASSEQITSVPPEARVQYAIMTDARSMTVRLAP